MNSIKHRKERFELNVELPSRRPAVSENLVLAVFVLTRAVYRGKYKFWLNNFGFCLDWIDYADNRGGMKTKKPDHHPGKSYNVRIRGRQFLTFHAANVQIWAAGHFLSRLVKHNRNNNNQLRVYKERLDMLVWLHNPTNIFLPAAHCQTSIGLFQNQESQQKLLLLYFYFYIHRPRW